jgi:hypothetical protein
MPIDVKCPQCGSGLEVPDEATGKKARCPDCGAIVAVPWPDPADILLADDASSAIAVAPADGPGTPTPPAAVTAARPERRGGVAGPSLLAPARNGPARLGSSCALLSLVPGVALLFGPLALLLGLAGLIVGRLKGRSRATRDVVAALGLGLLTSAGNWGLFLYVVSVLGVPEPVLSAFHLKELYLRLRPPPRDVAGVRGAPDPGFDRDPDWDPFGEKDKANPARLKSLRVGRPGVRTVAFSSDGKRLAIRQFEGVELWDLETERHRPIDAVADALALSPDGKWLAAVEREAPHEVRLYDPDTGEYRKKLAGDAMTVPPKPLLAFSPDGSLLAAARAGGVRLWRTADWQELPTGIRQEDFEAGSLAFSPDGSTLAVALSGLKEGTVLLWDTRQGKERSRFRVSDFEVKELAFAPDGRTLAFVGWNDKIKLWDVTKGSALRSIDRDPFNEALGFSPDGRLLVSCGLGDSLTLWEAATGKRLAAAKRGWVPDHHLIAAKFTADSATLLTASDEGVVETWDVAALLKQGLPR